MTSAYRYFRSISAMAAFGTTAYQVKQGNLTFPSHLTTPFSASMTALCQSGLDFKHPNVTTLYNNHSIKFLLSQLRTADTKTAAFRHYADRIILMLLEEAIAQEVGEPVRKISAAGGEYDHYDLKHDATDYCAITIIRAGDSMLQQAFDLLPGISVGKVLIQRDEATAEPIYYYHKLPDDIAEKKRVFIVDPMLATGGSVCKTIELLRISGVQPENITFINLVGCEEGIARVMKEHDGVKIITAAVDPELNSMKYIIPGLGDFGDRYFGSKLP